MKFGMFFVGEYLGFVLVSSLITVLFWWLDGSGLSAPVVWFALKSGVFIGFLFYCGRRFRDPDTTSLSWAGSFCYRCR